VELQSLSVSDFESILTQTRASLVKQYQALLATEGVTLEFMPDGVTRLASIAFEVNERTENIGARRLSTVMERLLDEVSFDATRLEGQSIRIDAAYVDQRLAALSHDEDLSRFISEAASHSPCNGGMLHALLSLRELSTSFSTKFTDSEVLESALSR
jgi:ATP-dependent HslUV protease ATP-binding subunit HslU